MQNETHTHRESLVRVRLRKAENDLKDAKLLLDAGSMRGSISRSYISVFHSIQAILASDGRTARRHDDLFDVFDREYIKKGLFSPELGRRVSEARDLRNECEYDDFRAATKAAAEDQIKTGEAFRAQAVKYCASKLPGA